MVGTLISLLLLLSLLERHMVRLSTVRPRQLYGLEGHLRCIHRLRFLNNGALPLQSALLFNNIQQVRQEARQM